MQVGRIYTLTRTVEKLLAVGETVLVDNGDGTQSEMSVEAFREMAKEDRG